MAPLAIDMERMERDVLPHFIIAQPTWSVDKSSELYRVHRWGAPYFHINAAGHIGVHPFGKQTKPSEDIDLAMVMQKAVQPKSLGGLGLSPPLLVRFPDILKHRVDTLQAAFDAAITEFHYDGRFQGVFPVKCNQDSFVIESILQFGKWHAFGLESGSKPELLLAMASMSRESADALLICNGYKDAEYVKLALMARQIGINCIIVLEQEKELELVLRISEMLAIEPVIGMRAKLNTKHGGHFGSTSGEEGKFGLSCSEMLRIVKKLQRTGNLSCLQLLHFHIGSQIPSLTILNDGVIEAAHIFCEFSLMGANMKYIDIGGGLGIDYNGFNSENSELSVGYTVEAYAHEVVKAVKDACMMKGVKTPTLCSESGRALVSHHSVLVFDVLSASRVKGAKPNLAGGVKLAEPMEGLPDNLKMVCEQLIVYAYALDYEGALVCAKQLKASCVELFKQGQLSLMWFASIDNIFDAISAWVHHCKSMEDGLLSDYTAVYHVNLSVFKSMPDTWAIGQLFPIVPLQRLEEEPKVRAILSDLTCDSDGQLTRFAVGGDERSFGGHERIMNHMRVHDLRACSTYYMGMFLGGAYQEALGGLHNLFGAPAVVKAYSVGAYGWKVAKVSDGQSQADVLRLMQHQPPAMLKTLRSRVQQYLQDEEAATNAFYTLACSFMSSTYLSTNIVGVWS